MDVSVSDLAVGLMMNLFGLLGLFLAARALDSEMFVFGLSLAAFSYLFTVGLIRRHFDTLDTVHAALREAQHG